MRILGLDVGDKTIGIAINDMLNITAQGVETYIRENMKADVKYIIDKLQKYKIDILVVGLPKNMNGSLGFQGEKVLNYVKQLEKKLKYSTNVENNNIKIVLWDERLSTIQAEKVLMDGKVRRENRKKYIDKIAATFILQSYMDSIN